MPKKQTKKKVAKTRKIAVEKKERKEEKVAKKRFTLKDTLYIKSFKEMDMKLVYITVLSLGFFGVYYLLSLLFNFIIGKLGIMELVALNQNLAGAGEDSALYAQQLYSKLTAMMIYFAVFVLLIIIAWSVLEGLVMLLLYKKKFNLKLISKFFVINLIIAVVFILLLMLVYLLLKSQTAAAISILIIAIVVVYFTAYIELFFFKDEKFWLSIKKAFCFGTGKINRTLPPFLLAALTTIVFLIPFLFLLRFVPNTITGVIYLTALLYALAWARSYLKKVVVEIDRN